MPGFGAYSLIGVDSKNTPSLQFSTLGNPTQEALQWEELEGNQEVLQFNITSFVKVKKPQPRTIK